MQKCATPYHGKVNAFATSFQMFYFEPKMRENIINEQNVISKHGYRKE